MAIDARTIEANHARMETARSQYDVLWSETASLVFPRQGGAFTARLQAAGWDDLRVPEAEMHEPYAVQALEDGVSAFEGFVMPRGQRWQTLEVADESLMRRVRVQQWLELVERRLFALRNDPESGFANAVHESASSLFAFGTQSMWIEKRYDWRARDYVGLSYRSDWVGDVWFECDAQGLPMRTHRSQVMTAEAAALKFGLAELPEKMAQAAASDNPDTRARKFTVLHVIEPNHAMDPARLDWRGKPWWSCYYSVEDKAVFREGGYDSLPRVVSRFANAPNQTYGWSPTMAVLPQIRALQQMTLDRLAAAELAMMPPLLSIDDDLDGGVLDLKGYGVTRGGLDDRGNPLFREFLTQADATDAEKLTMEARAAIDKAFYRDLFQLNREQKTHVSALRTQEEIAEKGQLLAPLARQEHEWLSPMTQRELALMDELGLLDDMPGEVAEYFAANGGITLRYDNTLSHMQEATGSAAFMSLAQQVGLMAQYDPGYIEHFNREFPPSLVLPELGRIAGVPAAMKASDEDKAAFDAEKQQKAQLDALLQAAPALAGAAKDAANAGQMMDSAYVG